jgi:16S rRNA (guanine1207-N2)-methyltransferase
MVKHKSTIPFPELLALIPGKVRPSLAIVLGSPNEIADICASLGNVETICYQMDLHQAERLEEELGKQGSAAKVVTAADLWDLPGPFQTVLYPVPQGGERGLKIDMIEQAYHILAPSGQLIVLSPYEKDQFFPLALKKIYKRVHAPATGGGALFLCHRQEERRRRRHEMTFQVQSQFGRSLRFLSRPGVFSYGRFDDGARALVETMDVQPGKRVLDLGCGCGTNGIFAGLAAGPDGFTAFVDSNVRAVALADFNARAQGLENFQTIASSGARGLPDKKFDVVLANPPYYAQQAIARLFIERAHECLRADGRLFLVTRQADQVGPMVAEVFGPAEVVERRGYIILCARKNH